MGNPLNSATVANSYTGSRATDRGTSIVKPGSDMDKNSFLKILSAELANQDPTQNQDSTQYISQMAQFTSMEQMSNLNSTMSGFASNSLTGKGVTLREVDDKGNPITGVVQAVTNQNGKTTLSVQVNENGQNVYKDYDISDVVTVLEVPDYSLPALSSLNGNMSLLMATSFIDKKVQLSDKDSSGNYITGVVVGVTKDNGVVSVRMKNDTTGEIITVGVDKITKVDKQSQSGTTA